MWPLYRDSPDSFLNTQILRFLSTFCQTDQNLVKLTICHTHQRFGLSCSKLTTSLVDETLKFQTYCTQKCCHFFAEKMWGAFAVQSSSQFFSKNITGVEFVRTCTLWLNESANLFSFKDALNNRALNGKTSVRSSNSDLTIFFLSFFSFFLSFFLSFFWQLKW